MQYFSYILIFSVDGAVKNIGVRYACVILIILIINVMN